MDNRNQVDWKHVLRWTRQKYRDLRRDAHGHNSHGASAAINAASEHFGIGFGAEGWCDECGRNGFTYLNMGDAYDTTILFSSREERFRIGCWGDILEAELKAALGGE